METREKVRFAHYCRNPKLIVDLIVILVITIALLAGTVDATISSASWRWAQRAGAPLVVIGTVLFGRVAYRPIYKRHELAASGEQELDHDAARELLQRRADQLANKVGLVLSAVGSLIWGYGDLLSDRWIRQILHR